VKNSKRRMEEIEETTALVGDPGYSTVSINTDDRYRHPATIQKMSFYKLTALSVAAIRPLKLPSVTMAT